MKKSKKQAMLNMGSSLALQLVTIVSGFIIPRLLLQTFGSEVNGLVSSLNQFLSYIALLEGGLTAVIAATFYKPLYRKNKEKISGVVAAANKFFHKLALVFLIYTIGLAVIYPLVVNTSFDFGYVATLTLILSVNLFSQYCFSLTWKIMLTADKKVAYVSWVQIFAIVLNTVGVVVLIRLWPEIHVIKLMTSATYLLQPLLFNRYIRKHYEIDKRAKPDDKALARRWDGFGINVAAFIHNNTDVVVLTVLSDLLNVSVYSVYFLVASGLKNLILAISNALNPSLGHAYASGDKKGLARLFDKYELIIYFATFFLFTVGGICVTPFVMLYTSGVTDVNYYQPAFGWLLIVAEMVFCLREPYVGMTYVANRFKDFTKIAYIEAGINIVLSVILVRHFGILGVAIGTLVAMIFRSVAHVIYLKKEILQRSIWKVVTKIVVFCALMVGSVVLSRMLFSCGEGVGGWILYALENSVLVGVMMGIGVGIFWWFSKKTKE